MIESRQRDALASDGIATALEALDPRRPPHRREGAG